MTATPRELFDAFLRAGVAHDAKAQAELFAVDGVFEAPLAPPGGFPRRTEGREAIRAMLTHFHEVAGATQRRIKQDESRLVVHETANPDVIVTEIDVRFENVATGEDVDRSLVQVYRVRDGEIVLLRDYFAANHVA